MQDVCRQNLRAPAHAALNALCSVVPPPEYCQTGLTALRMQYGDGHHRGSIPLNTFWFSLSRQVLFLGVEGGARATILRNL